MTEDEVRKLFRRTEAKLKKHLPDDTEKKDLVLSGFEILEAYMVNQARTADALKAILIHVRQQGN